MGVEADFADDAAGGGDDMTRRLRFITCSSMPQKAVAKMVPMLMGVAAMMIIAFPARFTLAERMFSPASITLLGRGFGFVNFSTSTIILFSKRQMPITFAFYRALLSISIASLILCLLHSRRAALSRWHFADIADIDWRRRYMFIAAYFAQGRAYYSRRCYTALAFRLDGRQLFSLVMMGGRQMISGRATFHFFSSLLSQQPERS